MSVTLPTHDWDFRQTATTTIKDSISGFDASYNNGLTSDTTNGLDLTGTSADKFASLAPFNTGTEFSMEFYFQKTANTGTNWPYLIDITSSPSSASTGDNFVAISWDMDNEPHDLYCRLDSTSGTRDTILIDDANVYAHFVVTFSDTTKELKQYLNGSLVLTDTINTSLTDKTYTHNYLGATPVSATRQFNSYFYYFRYWKNGILSSSEIATLYANRATTNYFSLANMRINYGDVYLAQTLNKTLADYKSENIPLNDVSFAAFPINKFKETYILGDVDISGDTILRSNNTYFTDISADTFDVSGNLLMSDLSANSRLFVGDDVSFNSNVTIQGDLSFGGDISFNGTFTRALAGIGTGSGLLINTDFSMNANLEFNGATTVKNDLHFNAYSDVSANPVLTDGTLLHNQKMEKLDHRYLLDISRSSPFSTLNYNTLPSNIYDNSTNSGICISGDGKYIRTVNSSDVSANATSYYSEDYGSSFQVDNDLSTKLSQFDLSINSLNDYNDYYKISIPGTTYTNEPQATTGNWSSSQHTGNFTAQNNHSSGTYKVTCQSILDNIYTASYYQVWNVFAGSNSSGWVGNRTGWNNDQGGTIRRHSSLYKTVYDENDAATNVYGEYIKMEFPYFFKVTNFKFTNTRVNNYVNAFMLLGDDSTGKTRVLHPETAKSTSYQSQTSFDITTDWIVNTVYLHIVQVNSNNRFVGCGNFNISGVEADTILQTFIPTFGSDKVFMSYNGQHQLVPRGISNNKTYDDFLYVSNNFGKNWNLRKNNTISTTTYAYTVTANGSSNYILNGGGFSSTAQPAVYIYLNESTEFTIDSTTNGNHPFKIGTSENGGEITDSRITSVTSGSNQVVTFKPTTSGTFYYYCSSHSGMGSSINVIEPAGRFNLDASGSSWFWNTGAVSADGKHMYVSGKTGLWKSQDFGTSWYQASADSSFNYMSISADGKQVYGVNERKVYGSSDYGNTFSTLYTDSYTSDSSYCGISTSGNGKYITLADKIGSNIYMSSDYGNSFDLKPAPGTEYTVANITTPNFDWNFLVTVATGGAIYDSISNLSGTYESGLTGDATLGTVNNSNAGRLRIPSSSVSFHFNFSMEFVVRINSALGYHQVFFSHSNDGKYGFGLYYGNSTSNQLRFFGSLATVYSLFQSDTTGTYTGSALSTDGSTYYHIVCVLDGANDSAYMYQDGTKIWEQTSIGLSESDFPITPSTYVCLGKEQQATNINVKRFRIWENHALSATEVTALYNDQTTNYNALLPSINCGMSHSGKIVLNSNYISYNYGNNFTFVPDLISNQLTNNDTFYSKANMEYLLDPSNNLMLSIPYKSAQFQDIYSVGSIKVGSTTYSSDYRIKKNVEELGEEDTVNELRPVKYYNTNLESYDYGLIAHELQEKYPFLVSGEKDGPEPQSINYNGLIGLLVHEVKNLKKEYLELKEMKK